MPMEKHREPSEARCKPALQSTSAHKLYDGWPSQPHHHIRIYPSTGSVILAHRLIATPLSCLSRCASAAVKTKAPSPVGAATCELTTHCDGPPSRPLALAPRTNRVGGIRKARRDPDARGPGDTGGSEVGVRRVHPCGSPASLPGPSAKRRSVRTATTTSKKKKMQRSKRVRIMAGGSRQPHTVPTHRNPLLPCSAPPPCVDTIVVSRTAEIYCTGWRRALCTRPRPSAQPPESPLVFGLLPPTAAHGLLLRSSMVVRTS
jgi:hypothetical protein